MYLHRAERARRVDDEGAAKRKPLVRSQLRLATLDEDAEGVSELAGGVGRHRIFYFSDALRGVVPRLMREDGIRRDRDNFGVQRLELRVELRELLELCRADEGEVRGIEDENEPPPAELREAHHLDFPLMIRFKFEVGHRLAHLHERQMVMHEIVELSAILAIVAFGFFHKKFRFKE